MDVALDSLRAHHTPGEVSAALFLMQVYINNIVKEPQNEKFRKIRISNPRFNSTIWQLEPARTFLLLCGFEEQEGFLVVPLQVSLEGAKTLIDGVISTHTPAKNPGADSNNTVRPAAQTTSVLKLGDAKGGSLFAPDVKADLTLMSYMKEFGYELKLAEKALIATKNAGVQPAMDWIAAHPDAAVDESTPSGHGTEYSSQVPTTGGNQASVQPAPVSRYQKTVKERHKFQERQRQEAIEAARLEKQQKKLQKQYLLQEMKGEKEAKKEMTELAKRVRTCAEATESMATGGSGGGVPDQRRTVDACADGQTELRIRLPDGKASILSLPSESPIHAVYQHVCQTTALDEDEFVLVTSFPHVELSRAGTTLAQAGLSPRATLVVTRRDQQGVVTQGQGAVVRVKNIGSLDEWQDAISKATEELVVVMFHTSWCASSRSVSDAYEALNAQYCNSGGKPVLLVRADIDKLKVLKYQNRVTTTPTFKLFWNEKVVGVVAGADLDQVRELIEANRAGPPCDEEQERSEGDGEFHDPR